MMKSEPIYYIFINIKVSFIDNVTIPLSFIHIFMKLMVGTSL